MVDQPVDDTLGVVDGGMQDWVGVDPPSVEVTASQGAPRTAGDTRDEETSQTGGMDSMLLTDLWYS